MAACLKISKNTSLIRSYLYLKLRNSLQ
jgi:hypothetical protein